MQRQPEVARLCAASRAHAHIHHRLPPPASHPCLAGITADACSGDSGGPLFYPPMNGNPAILIGLVSYGPDCDETLASGSTPVGFYTDLRKHFDAIMAWVEGHQYNWAPPLADNSVGSGSLINV